MAERAPHYIDHAARITEIIDTGLAPGELVVSPDLRLLIESEVWAELSESVELGFRTEDEAIKTFLGWRSEFFGTDHINGTVPFESSQLEQPACQETNQGI